MVSGSGAQMQSTSYLPGFYRLLDQNVGNGGSFWQVLSNGTACKIGRVYNAFPEPSGSDPCLAYNKEILRQTMLKHEAIFRNQVYELHRLYGRQRELMNEISRDHLHMQTPKSNLIPSQMQFNIFQKGLEKHCLLLTSPEDGKPPARGGENFHMPSASVSEKSTQAGSIICVKENALEEQRVSTSRSNYSGKRILDLELPAEEYIDSEDEEALEERNSAQVPQVQYDPSKSASWSPPTKSNLKLNEASSSNGSSNCSKSTFLFDLNEPIQLDESETPNSANCVDSSTDIMHQNHDSFSKSKSESHGQNEEGTDSALAGKRNEGSSLISGLQDSSAEGSPHLCGDITSLGSKVAKKESEIFDDNNQRVLSSCMTNSCSSVLISNEAKTEASTSVSSQKTSVCNFKEIPLAIQALMCFANPESMSKTSRSSTSNAGIRKYCNSKRNTARSPSLGSISYCPTSNGDNDNAAEQSSLAECINDANHAKSSVDMDVHVMPHRCLPGTVVSQEKHRSTDRASSPKNSNGQFKRPIPKPDHYEMNLEAPVSPDNKEHPPPRGESEEYQIEMPSHTSKQKTGDPNEDLDRIAAEAIISISSLGIQQFFKNDKDGTLEVSIDCLIWFAGIVSSVTGDQEIEFERLLNDATGDIEHIEAKLTGIKIGESCPETSNQKSKTIASMMLPCHQEQKGQARKTRQRKGFLSRPPCIALCPLSDVTENLQPTEQLMPAAGSPSGSIKGERRFGRNGRPRRSRNWKKVSSWEIERRVCSLLKQHTFENELSSTVRSLLGWGRKYTRQKNRKARAHYCLRFD